MAILAGRNDGKGMRGLGGYAHTEPQQRQDPGVDKAVTRTDGNVHTKPQQRPARWQLDACKLYATKSSTRVALKSLDACKKPAQTLLQAACLFGHCMSKPDAEETSKAAPLLPTATPHTT